MTDLRKAGLIGRRRMLAAGGLPILLHLPRAATAAPPPNVIVTFSILADLLKEIAADDVKARVIVGPDSDVHHYQVTSADMRSMASVQMIVSNGLGFEWWLKPLIAAARPASMQLVASSGIVPLLRPASRAGEPAATDPHCWQDVSLARRYIANIVAGLASIDGENASRFHARAAAYDARLQRLDEWIKRALDEVPPGKRRVITGHDAFEYFAKAYDVEFLAVRDMNMEREPSAKDVAGVIALARKEQIKALFIENMTNAMLVEQIAAECGGYVGAPLYSDALSSPAGPAATYEAMMRHNVSSLIAGMRKN